MLTIIVPGNERFIVNAFLIIITITTFIFLQITMTIIIIHYRLQQLLL